MEIPVWRYRSIASSSSSSSSCSSSSTSSSSSSTSEKVASDPIKSPLIHPKSLPSGSCFFTRKSGNPFSGIRHSAESELQPRPKPIPPPTTSNVVLIGKEARPVHGANVIASDSDSAARICGQIDMLVLYERHRDALELFDILALQGGDSVPDVPARTYDALVTACIELKSIRGAKAVYKHIMDSGFEPDQHLCNRVLHMHVKCGLMIDALRVFDQMPDKNIASWNTIIAGLVDSCDYLEAFRLFLVMWPEFWDAGSHTFTFATIIRACAGLGVVGVGRQLHSCALKLGVYEDVYVSCALIDMYSKCGSIEEARWVFDEMPKKTTVAWNTIIAGYALHGYSEKALGMFYEMREYGARMDHFSFSIIVRICARLASLGHAKQAHASLIHHGFEMDIVANTALVDLYSKWGKMEDARRVFDLMPCKNVISWNALISGYGSHGWGAEGVAMFEMMLKEGMKPNHITFLAVLSACSHSGLSDCGWRIFESMSRDYNIKPRAMHYACMVELLGREGLLDEAFASIRDAPVEPTINMWAALLTACRVHKNIELGKFAAQKIFEMEPEKLSSYVVLLNIYSNSRKLEEAAEVLQTLRRRGLNIVPVCSWIEINRKPHFFISGDKSHIQSKEIHQKVDSLLLEISKLGYVPEAKFWLPDVDEQEEQLLRYHSEKLAVACGLINTSDWVPLQVVQSHRICNDCHNAIKLFATVTGREIVVKDASSFHHFKDGSCSCGDYW